MAAHRPLGRLAREGRSAAPAPGSGGRPVPRDPGRHDGCLGAGARDAANFRIVTGKADFTDEEWKTVLEAPPSAGFIVILSDRGGSVRETFSMAKAYTEARRQHGESQLLDEVVAAKPAMDHTRAGSPEELKQHNLDNIRQAVALLRAKATDQEVDEYRKFILGLAEHVAEARKEGFLGLSGERVSDAERAAIGEIESALA